MSSDVDIVRVADEAVGAFYWQLFHLGMGARFHSFLEWCGVMREHTKMVRSSGVDPFEVSTHSGVHVAVPGYQLAYMAEKLNCILAPFLKAASPEDRATFVRILLEGE